MHFHKLVNELRVKHFISAFSYRLFVLCVICHLKHFPVYFSTHEMKLAECNLLVEMILTDDML